mgnify:CR=1 FL=1
MTFLWIVDVVFPYERFSKINHFKCLGTNLHWLILPWSPFKMFLWLKIFIVRRSYVNTCQCDNCSENGVVASQYSESLILLRIVVTTEFNSIRGWIINEAMKWQIELYCWQNAFETKFLWYVFFHLLTM